MIYENQYTFFRHLIEKIVLTRSVPLLQILREGQANTSCLAMPLRMLNDPENLQGIIISLIKST